MREGVAISLLLVRWHRWAASPVRADDSMMRDFDALVLELAPEMRIALQVQARNLACGAEVWSSIRIQPDARAKASEALKALLATDPDRWFGRQLVYLNERGNRVGESNPRAELTDHEVELMLELREEGKSYGWLADKFECSKSAVQWICNGGRRGQVPARVKVVSR